MPLVKEVLKLNELRSREFSSPAAHDARALYQSQHPTNILVFKCMDGRVNLPLITGIPMGILRPFRNIGGKFTLGYPYLGRLVLDAKEEAVRQGRPTLALCTYHFSKGSEHRSCAGHNYDTAAARRGAVNLKKEFETIFGMKNSAISAIVVGIETDEDALTFCNGVEKNDFSIADHVADSDDEISRGLQALYPHLETKMLNDLLPLALGNRDHVARIRREGRPVTEIVHGENIICVGRGFDWLHMPNRALIIGPYGDAESTWRDAVRVAGNIVLDNFKKKRVPKAHGALLLVAAPYSDMKERELAIAKVGYFATVASQVLSPVAKKLGLDILTGVTDMQTMKFHQIKREKKTV